MSEEECRDVFARLSEYLDGELPEDLCRRIEQHIGGCAPCVEFVKSLEKSIELCRGYRPSEQPAPLAEDVRQQLLEAYRKALGSIGGQS